MNTSQLTAARRAMVVDKQRNYNEIVEYLDSHWSVRLDPSLDRMRQLDKALETPSVKVPSILVAGTNGKSLTIHFTAKLLKAEGLKVGVYSAPHILTYNERFALDKEAISNKVFTEIGNDVIRAAESLGIEAHTSELLTAMALVFFKNNQVDVALFEVSSCGKSNAVSNDPVTIIPAKVATITRVTAPTVLVTEEQLATLTQDMMSIVKKGTHIVSGDQSKSMLQLMQRLTQENGGHWAMPIRKLAALPYPYEQLYGRCAALAERLAQLFIEKGMGKLVTIVATSLLCKPKGQRGRPTLEAKRYSELNPRKTIEQFWKEEVNELPGKFQLLDKEKPSILLDTANNIDAFKNILLGIRLLHYQSPLKGLTIIIGAAKNTLHNEEFLKLLRYFFKKTAGQVIICPLSEVMLGVGENESWDIEQVVNDIKSMKVKARAYKTFEEAFDMAKKSVDERNGLVAICGSQSIVNAYWKLKGIKKF